jgi:hypothetical protein
MVATRSQKRRAAEISNPLNNSGVLQNVLSYVGAGHHLFVALVNKDWREMHRSLESQELTVHSTYTVICDSQTTRLTSVLTSPARVKLAHKSGLDCTSLRLQYAAGKHADIATLAAAHELGLELDEIVLTGAAALNKLAEVQYLHSKGCDWPVGLLEEAASKGYFELLRWCYEHGCPFDDDDCVTVNAADSGNVELMAWVLQQPGTKLYSKAMSNAALRGDLAMCQFLYEQKCPWSKTPPCEAAYGCYLEILRWLVDNSCPYDAHSLCMYAVRGGSIDVMTYLQQQLGLLTSVATLTEMLDFAAIFKHIPAAKWLRDQGAEWPSSLIEGRWFDEMKEWAIVEGFTSPII